MQPAGAARLSSPANSGAAAQIHAEDALSELLQVGVTPTDLSILQAKTAALIPTDKDERIFEDAPLAARPAWA
jgi:hypothetical protein